MDDTALIREPARQLPVRNAYDVIVCGGGLRGVATAVSAMSDAAPRCVDIGAVQVELQRQGVTT